MLRLAVAALLGTFSGTAGMANVGPPISLPTLPGGERSFGTANEGLGDARSGGLLNQWRYRSEWGSLSASYSAALSFARCVNRVSPGASKDLFTASLTEPSTRSRLALLARKHRACVSEIGAVPPVLIRAAFAEIIAISPGTGVRQLHPIGLPRAIDGFHLALVAECQLRSSPEGVTQILRTDPSTVAERRAAEALFESAPACSNGGLGRISPTVIRLMLVEATIATAQQ